VNFYFGGTSLLIVVGVAMDTINQIEAQLIMRHTRDSRRGPEGSGAAGACFRMIPNSALLLFGLPAPAKGPRRCFWPTLCACRAFPPATSFAST